MDSESIDFDSESRRMEKEINYYKLKLRNCRERYERMQMEIYGARQSQREALSVLDNTLIEERYLSERFKDIRLNYDVCVDRSNDYADLEISVRKKMNELATQRNVLMEELTRLRRNADANNEKLARVNAMITEQEERNALLMEELTRKSENVAPIPADISKRIRDVARRMNQ